MIYRKQSGSALVISLLILLVMTMIGISSLSSSSMEEKMAANDRNHKLVFQNAESALRIAEASIAAQSWRDGLEAKFITYGTDADGNITTSRATGYRTSDDAAFDYYLDSSWSPGTTCIEISSLNACYIIEQISIDREAEFSSGYKHKLPMLGTLSVRITARTTDDSGSKTAVILQTTLEKTIVQ